MGGINNIQTKYIWHNGKMINREDAQEHNVCHGLHYGTSVFEGIRCYPTQNGAKIFRLKEHIERLFFSAKILDIDMSYSIDEIMQACKTLIKENELEGGYIRPIVYYGQKKMGLDPTGADINVSISCWPWGKYLSDAPVKVGISKYKRLHPESSEIRAKIGGHYFNSVLAHKEVVKRGFDEALLLDPFDFIAEGPGENIFFIKDNDLFTPATGSILPGITRDTVMQIAQDDLGFNVVTNKIPGSHFKNYDEAFFSGTAAEITLIGSITDLQGNIKEYKTEKSMKIKQYYSDIVYGKVAKYLHWLY